MKIFNNDVVYVQKKDILKLRHANLLIPASIFYKAHEGSLVYENMQDFIEFRNEEDLDFFKGIDWILDYDELKKLTDDQLIKCGKNIVNEQRDLLYYYNTLTLSEKMNNQKLIEKNDFLEYKFSSIKEFIEFKRGNINVNLPCGVEYPDGYVSSKVDKKEKGVKKLIKKIFID